jgi:hypothetical protein
LDEKIFGDKMKNAYVLINWELGKEEKMLQGQN